MAVGSEQPAVPVLRVDSPVLNESMRAICIIVKFVCPVFS